MRFIFCCIGVLVETTWTINIPISGIYRHPMTAESIAEDEAHFAENKRRFEAGEERLPPLPQLEYEQMVKYYVVDRVAKPVSD